METVEIASYMLKIYVMSFISLFLDQADNNKQEAQLLLW